MPISLNPLHYALLASIIFNVGILGYSQVIKTRLALTVDEFRAFKAKVSSEAEEQKLKNLRETRERNELTLELEERNAKLKKDLDSRYAEYKRLLNSTTSSRGMPKLSEAAERIDCPDSADRLARSLDKLERGVLERLAKPRDEAVSRTILAKDWIESQANVK